jgi:cell division protein ZapA
MGQVSINIRGKSYQIACDDGQEAHLARLGRYLDQQAEHLLSTSGRISDNLLMVMVALMVADELSEATAKLDSHDAAGRAAREQAEAETAVALMSLAKRIETVAATLERA